MLERHMRKLKVVCHLLALLATLVSLDARATECPKNTPCDSKSGFVYDDSRPVRSNAEVDQETKTIIRYSERNKTTEETELFEVIKGSATRIGTLRRANAEGEGRHRSFRYARLERRFANRANILFAQSLGALFVTTADEEPKLTIVVLESGLEEIHGAKGTTVLMADERRVVTLRAATDNGRIK
jgi:hypothetical protein